MPVLAVLGPSDAGEGVPGETASAGRRASPSAASLVGPVNGGPQRPVDGGTQGPSEDPSLFVALAT